MTERQISQQETPEGPVAPGDDPWRNELQDRLARYKRRRGRRIEGAFTMRFPFPADDEADTATASKTVVADMEPAEWVFPPGETEQAGRDEELAVAPTVEPPADPPILQLTEAAESSEPLPEPALADDEAAVMFVDPIPRPRPKRKVIAFPRQLSVVSDTVSRLADPVHAEAPRILDVPEELEAIPTTPFLDGLQLDPVKPAAEPRDRECEELLSSPVSVSRRAFAALIDIGVTSAGVAVFGAVAYKTLGNPALSKPLLLGLLSGAVILWCVYQYLFLVHAGKTLGMMAAQLKLRTFKGKTPNRSRRRTRALGLCLSALSLGMGLMWAFVDVDGLCWHDRLSRTCLSKHE
jgi:uncharacterized RDD family membrane protein YckC